MHFLFAGDSRKICFLALPASRDHPHSSNFKANNIGPSLSHTVISLALLCLPLFLLRTLVITLDPLGYTKAVVPNVSGTRNLFCGRQFSHGPGGRGEPDGFRVIQVHYVYYATADLIGGGAQAVM